MRKATSNAYYMEAPPKERTRISFQVGRDRAHCYGCGRTVLPRIIDTKFLSKPLAVCPHCRTVVQTPEPPIEEKPRTVFVWECQLCYAQYPENYRLPVDIVDGITRRKCPRCSGPVGLEQIR